MFTERDVYNAQRYVDGLTQSKARYARMGKVSLDTIEQDNDALFIGGACIMAFQGETTGLVPRPCIKYSVQVPYTVHGGYWEPDETDYNEVAQCDSLFDAIAQLYLQLADQYCRDVAMAVAYELDREITEEV